jgi:hypothetical protein
MNLYRVLSLILSPIYLFNNTIAGNALLIKNYAVRELMLLKFSLEASLFQKYKTNEHLQEFFTKNCFLLDYVFFWKQWGNSSSTDVSNTPNNNHVWFVHEISYPQGDTPTVLSLLPLQLLPKTLLETPKAALYTHVYILLKETIAQLSAALNKSFSFGFYYLQGFAFILFIDACLTDDEPLWEPIEWSLVQTWILFIFSFAWIAENLIVSRYGSYTGRDKRVWLSWYKTFWLIEGYYAINYGVACVFVIVPFYFETNYNLSFVYSWWHWYSRVFFFKFISVFTVILFISYYLQMSVRWLNWKKGLMLVLLVNIFLSYLIYTQFMMTFFGYFTDPVWYQKTRPIDYVQLSHEPARWGWGPAKKDHFTYHNVKTVFWFKNDGPFAASFLLFQTFLFVCIFLLYIYWISLFRRIYAMKEIPLTFTTYCVSSLKQFFYFFLMF